MVNSYLNDRILFLTKQWWRRQDTVQQNTNLIRSDRRHAIYNISLRLEKWADRLFRSASFVNEACFVTPQTFSNPVNFKQMLEGKERNADRLYSTSGAHQPTIIKLMVSINRDVKSILIIFLNSRESTLWKIDIIFKIERYRITL